MMGVNHICMLYKHMDNYIPYVILYLQVFNYYLSCRTIYSDQSCVLHPGIIRWQDVYYCKVHWYDVI